MTPQLEARAFAIWRFAEPRGWDVSYDEIADATGLTESQVKYAIIQKGWGGKIGSGGVGRLTSEKAHKLHKSLGHRFDENALDVVDLMAF